MKNGVPNYNEIVFEKEQQDIIVDMYVNQKMSSVKIGEYFGCSHKVILRELTNLGITERIRRRKYNVDEHYFDSIDTQNKAYILGFLYADGSNSMSKGTIHLSLHEQDMEILEKIRNEIKSEKPLEYLDYSNKHDFGYKYANQYRLLIFNKHICETLNNIGMIPNKSLSLEFPDINQNLYRHFIRGYFDGDGSFSINKERKNPTITITQTESFCNRVREILMNELHISGGGIYDASCHNGITKVLRISGAIQDKKILDWLYEDADMYLQRKYDRYLDLCNNYYNNN